MAKFQKGQSGNPGGRPKKGTTISDLLRELGDVCDVTVKGEKVSRKRALAEAVWKKAIMDGDFQCAKFIFERCDGLPKAELDLSVAGNLPFSYVDPPVKSEDASTY